MLKEYEKLFGKIKAPQPPKNLFAKIMRRVDEEIKLAALRRRIIFFSILLVASIGAFIPAFQLAWAEFSESGFVDFLSLIFSDLNSVAAYWQNLGIALLESLPVVSAIAVLSVVFVFLQSLKFLARDIKMFLHPLKIN